MDYMMKPESKQVLWQHHSFFVKGKHRCGRKGVSCVVTVYTSAQRFPGDQELSDSALGTFFLACFFHFSLLELINCLPAAGNVSLW